jgi:hypothetical protein
LSEKHVHIVSFDVPYPANYGGVIDVFYRIQALHKLGVKITLHCFEYGRGEQKELLKYVDRVFYYKRKRALLDSLGSTPFIVKTRRSPELLNNLLIDQSPILFEGLHTCFHLNDPQLKNRKKIVRTHNVEHEYYDGLAQQTKGPKKAFFASESRKLKVYENQLSHADHILAIKDSDADHFEKYNNSVLVLPASCPDVSLASQQSTEPFCLYHGNLSVLENETGAMWLINNVFSSVSLINKLKIAGKNPSKRLIKLCETENIELIKNPEQNELDALMSKSRVHVFYTDQTTGIKLKLVNALATSGHIVLNSKMTEGLNLQDQIHIADSAKEFGTLVEQCLENELTNTQFLKRKELFNSTFNTLENCKTIISLL